MVILGGCTIFLNFESIHFLPSLTKFWSVEAFSWLQEIDFKCLNILWLRLFFAPVPLLYFGYLNEEGPKTWFLVLVQKQNIHLMPNRVMGASNCSSFLLNLSDLAKLMWCMMLRISVALLLLLINYQTLTIDLRAISLIFLGGVSFK